MNTKPNSVKKITWFIQKAVTKTEDKILEW